MNRTYSSQIALGALVALVLSALMAAATADTLDYKVHNAIAAGLVIVSAAVLLTAVSCRSIERARQQDRRQ